MKVPLSGSVKSVVSWKVTKTSLRNAEPVALVALTRVELEATALMATESYWAVKLAIETWKVKSGMVVLVMFTKVDVETGKPPWVSFLNYLIPAI